MECRVRNIGGLFMLVKRESCIFGAMQKNGVWRKRYDHELYELFNEPDIVRYIKINRLGWAGHVNPFNGVTAQIGPWPLLRFHNNNVLRCEVVSLTTNLR
jgi:hypothetical protein